MENKEFPEQEEKDLPIFELNFSSPAQEPTEPVLSNIPSVPPEELSFEEALAEIPFAEEVPAEEEIPFTEEIPAEEIPFLQEILPEEIAPPAEAAPVEAPLPAEPEVPELQSELDLTEGDQEYADVEPREIVDTPVPDKKHHRRQPRKGRPKKRGGEGFWGIPSILVTVVWLALIVAIGVTAGRMAWVCAADVLAFGREDKPVTVTIYERDTMEDITNKLFDAGLIRYKSLFNLYATFSNAEEDIKPGIYDLNTLYDYHALVNFMSPTSNRTIVKVMIPEGYTCNQIFALLEENKVCTALDLATYAATGTLDDYWFLEGVERGETNSLEGFLFPDTYEFYKNDSPKNILQKMLNNFDNRFDEDMRGQIDSLNNHLADLMRNDGKSEEYIADHLFTVREVATVASMIEKETAHSGESPLIASVIYNRLFNWGGTPAYLNIDASIVYALGGKTDLTREDLQVDSPYNTYLHTGLTPTPIANPGLTSLKAALNPENTNYYFYVLNPAEGSHQFSTTREEHEANVTRFAAQ